MKQVNRRVFLSHTGLGAITAATLASATNANAKETLQEKNKAICRRYYTEAIHNVELVEELFSPDYVEPQNPKWSIEGHKKLLLRNKRGFPDGKMKIVEMVAEGEKVAIAYVWTGTHKGEWRGIAPTGNKLKIHGMNIYQIKDGKIVHGLYNFDTLGVWQQLGYKLVSSEK